MKGEDTKIRELGYVPDDELPALYAGARVLLMPSLYEGFGLPCLEAMASGTPVVAANRGALPEICGDAALVVEPEEFADAAVEAVGNERLTQAGLARAARFTWERTARETDQAIEAILTERGS
jgi:glycosyltransferase involved in cell wall biosynthesis